MTTRTASSPRPGGRWPAPATRPGKYVGWRPLTLPYIEQENLQKLYDFNLNWWEGTNPTAAAVPVKTYQCPSTPPRGEVLVAPSPSRRGRR